VIESVFSGMARAIIHNSDYASVEAAKAAIDRYFRERNEHFIKHPRRAGRKVNPAPSRVVAGQDLLAEVRRRLSPEERLLAEQRALGREWADIATEVGGTPQARRKQLARAVERVSKQRGLEES